MCPVGPRAVTYHGERCSVCLSLNHSTETHPTLEKSFKTWGIGLRRLVAQADLFGDPGAPSLSTPGSGPPDLLRIVPSIISVLGFVPYRATGPAAMRLWKQDPEGGYTFTLSLDASADLQKLAAIMCGDSGSIGSVELRFNRTTPTGAPPTT